MRFSTLAVVLLLLSLSAGCSTASHDIPKWDGHWWAANSSDQAVSVEVQAPDPAHPGQKVLTKKVVRSADPAFNGFACTTYDELEQFVQTYLFGCREWRAP